MESRLPTFQTTRTSRRVVLKAAALLATLSATRGITGRVRPGDVAASGETIGYDWVEAVERGSVGVSSDDWTVIETQFPFTAVGAHWDGDQGDWPVVQITLSSDGETWTGPFRLDASPDLGRPTRDNRVFTGLVCASGANHIAYAIFDQDGSRASVPGFALTYIDSSGGPDLPTVGTAGSDDAQPPRILSRQEWGANESWRFEESGEWWTPQYQTVRHAIIHHSETSNVQNPLEAIRAIYYYHAVTRGWHDIGYNYLVDHDGNIYEGRAGGQNVVAGHALEYSYGSSGLCFIGNHADGAVRSSALAGMVAITAWAIRFQDPWSRATFHDIPDLPTICGHRDVMGSVCPGDFAYDELDTIRSLVEQTLATLPGGPIAGLVVGDSVETSDSVNVRTAAGLDSAVIRQTGPGTHGVVAAGPVIGNELVWYQVATDYETGWMVADYLDRRPPVDWKRGRFWRDQIVALNDSASFRRLPTTSGTLISTLSTGTIGQVLGGPEYADGHRWFKIRTSGGDGWVAARFLSTSSADAPEDSSPEPDIEGKFVIGDNVEVEDGPINVRSAAGTNAPILTTLPTGARRSVTAGPVSASGYVWYRLSGPSGNGWVADAFLKTAPGVPTPTGKFTIGESVIVSDGPVNVRAAAGTGAAILTQAQTGLKGLIVAGPQTASNYAWYQVTAGGLTGWIAQDFLTRDDSSPPSSPGNAFNSGDLTIVSDGPLYLRSGAGSQGSILTSLEIGAKCVVRSGPVHAAGYAWYQVSTSDLNGWVAGEFLVHAPRVGRTVRVVADGGQLRLRSSANTAAGVLALLDDGSTGTVLEGPQSADGYTWWRLQTPAGTGWAAGAFLTVL